MTKDKELFNFQRKDYACLGLKQKAVRDALQNKIGNVYLLVDKPCLCGSKDATLISDKDRYELLLNVVICKACGLIRLNPCLSSESLRQFYQKEYWDLYMGEEEAAPEKYFQGMVLRGNYIKDIFDEFIKRDWKGLNVLEVGCQAGGILSPFLKAGAYTVGYDYDKRYLEYGKKQSSGLDLRVGGVDDVLELKDKFDVIIVNHVLEHLTNPRDMISSLRGRLRENGLLYIAVPALANPGFYLSPTKSIVGGFHISHLYYFTLATLEECLLGFDVVYRDDKMRLICRCIKKNCGRTGKLNDSVKVLSFMHWYEGTFWGKVYRRLFSFWERYHNRIVHRMYSLRFIPRKFFIPFTN